MKVLFTADWQADFESLDLCRLASKEVLEICKDRHLNALVVAGDLKRAYNPIDTRIIQFWMDFIHQATKQGLKVVLVLGNHDRVGMYQEAQNWFPILERAGATVVHSGPMHISVKDGELFCLPFTSSVETTRKWAAELKHMHRDYGSDRVLVFHNDISGCSYNMLGQRSAGNLIVSD